jgi:small subunit ribosomal protein S20
MADEKTTAGPKDSAKKKESVRQPSALKRNIQGEKRRLRNRSFRSGALRAIHSFESSLSKKEASQDVQAKLQAVCSIMDRGVKKGIYKPNKASRTKSRLALRARNAL